MKPNYRTKPRRSALYTPGINTRALEKLSQSPADIFIIDLEDAVAPESKVDARQNVVAYLRNRPRDTRELIVRVNGLDSVWCEDDVRAVVDLSPDGILFPKINSAEDVARAEKMLSDAGAAQSMQMWCMIETPLSILNLQEIARQSTLSSSRMTTWVMGTNDLAKDTGAILTQDRISMLYALSAAIIAARAYELSILDGVYNDIADLDGLLQACEQGKCLGFDGKTAIHPTQVLPCNRAFSPGPEEILFSRRILDVFDQPENVGKGVLKVDGKMVEILHVQLARRVIAIADAIAERESPT
jgi:citrate lyase subunit beta/citryl-CoA lyase